MDAVKVKARFDDMKTSKKSLLEAAVTAEEKDELKEVITMHCEVVKEGESCVCAWCNDSNSGKKVSSKKTASTKKTAPKKKSSTKKIAPKKNPSTKK